MTGVQEDDGRWRGEIRTAWACRAMRTDRRRHSRARGAAPQRIAGCADAEGACVPEDVIERRRQILRRDRAAISGAVLQDESVIPPLADGERTLRTPGV
jgi:hypothetical protein